MVFATSVAPAPLAFVVKERHDGRATTAAKVQFLAEEFCLAYSERLAELLVDSCVRQLIAAVKKTAVGSVAEAMVAGL